MLTALTTLSNVKTILGIATSDTSQDALLNLYIIEVSQAVCDWCQVPDFGVVNYQEIYAGTNITELTLRHIPVQGAIVTGTITAGSPIITSVGSTSGLFLSQSVNSINPGVVGSVGVPVAPPAVPVGSYITNIGSTTVTINQNATASQTGASLAFGVAVWENDLAFAGDAARFNTGGPSSNLLLEGVDYFLDWANYPGGYSQTGILYGITQSWFRGYARQQSLISYGRGPFAGNFQAQYNAGYAIVPTSVQAAAELMLANLRQSRFWGKQVQGVRTMDQGATLAAPPATLAMGLITPEVAGLLRNYKQVQVG